jgi:hypothetical protein
MTLNLVQRYKKAGGIQNKLVYFYSRSGGIAEKWAELLPRSGPVRRKKGTKKAASLWKLPLLCPL